ncbi:MAG TPA: amylo-alpha-1,6-glucosidase [Steroidobacteraceae bacterium]|nr:amylo-alpha-1,6-glucosidase [Steroidobacteraceae bacterium]
MIAADRAALGDFDQCARREWLVTNGIGGFASSTSALLNTRRYHGLLIAALRPPVERVVLVTKLDATVRYAGVTAALATNEYADGTVYPHGYRYLDSLRLEGQHPVWTWVVGDAILEQRIWMAHGRNTTYVQYRLVRASVPMEIDLRPLCSYREYHSLRRGRADVGALPTSDGFRVAYAGARAYRIRVDGGTAMVSPDWHWNLKYREECDRGLDYVEDLFAPGTIELRLAPGGAGAVILDAETQPPVVPSAALDEDIARQRQLLTLPNKAYRREPSTALRAAFAHRLEVLPGRPGFDWRHLILAADQFVVERHDAAGKVLGKTIVAGYPWFADWGRDTMIALPGLALATGRYDVAASVLRTFAGFLSQGMLPNRFPEVGESPEYNSVDAALWFFVTVDEYLRQSGDESLRRDLYPALKESVAWHIRGTRYGIGVDAGDGLLRAGEKGTQLTWMDAKVGECAVTPRVGKCVEINALWYNALQIMKDLAKQERDSDASKAYASLAERMATSFDQRFWFLRGHYLYDVIDGPVGEDDGLGHRGDPSLRPNQIIALSLRYPLLRGPRARRVVDVCAQRLWTPVGLRSLAADDSRFVPMYRGGPRERDAAYHQGTVWSWLLGPFALAHFRAYGDAVAARSYLSGIEGHLRQDCLGQIGEIFDGEAPFRARGCYAQAWAVAETLRALSHLDEA